ncbi:hypothetical protein G7Y89_g8414 [Cudoniella acicularis]|uniref:FAD/NAD(P)-binding domain-containing protein n=1 Tax=Cudoniella acicularis TaxID=354080 RepID=A0A8H4W3K8_9HELO|nr:hypothetical protein G7Y89_g8414 [Cudoniella acicularis]
MAEAFEFYSKALRAMLGLTVTRTFQQLQAARHRWMYQETVNPKKIVIIGGSYAGSYLAQRLSETLPTGYKAVLIERNTHFNHLFVFPRFSVTPNKEHMAFVPYDSISSFGPPGVVEHIHDSATSITADTVQLASGRKVDYEYLALATGTWQPYPSKATLTEKSEACAELRSFQDRISSSSKIAVIGGGPVGVQIASDIASFFPSKNVTLIHSWPQLLPNFGRKLHEHTLQALKDLKVDVVLGERPELTHRKVGEKEAPILSFKGGRESGYDLVIKCTGQKPNSQLLEKFIPGAVCATTRQILVHPSLQIADPSVPSPRIFVLGDVAKTHGPHMARAARAHADVVTANILGMIRQQEPSAVYTPQIYEGVIKLSLGKNDYVWYGQDNNGKEVLMSAKETDENLHLSHLILAVRSQSKGETAASELRRQFPTAQIEVWLLDLESYKSVLDFSTRCKTLPRADVAILNAGLAMKRFRLVEETKHETTIQVNYLSTALLALLLLPLLKTRDEKS